jgi:hypothetical protein
MTEENFDLLFHRQRLEFEIEQEKIEQEKIEQEISLKKNAIRSQILQAQNIDDLNNIKNYITNNKLDLDEFFEDIKAKEEIINLKADQEKLRQDQLKNDEEKARLDKLEQDRLRKIEDDKKLEQARID